MKTEKKILLVTFIRLQGNIAFSSSSILSVTSSEGATLDNDCIAEIDRQVRQRLAAQFPDEPILGTYIHEVTDEALADLGLRKI